MSKLSFTAVIFDLDGVITQTALVHSRAWKEMFDEYLRFREQKYNEPFQGFTHDKDYLPYVDGKPRYKGVESFLKERGINLPFGDPHDPPQKETICGLGNRKDQKLNEILEHDGVKVYDSTIALIEELRRKGIHIGVASSSNNCKTVLEAAGIEDKFETRVDGIVSAKLKLKGKPEPDIFTTACDNLDMRYDQTVIVEDAISGVQAGRNGNFGLIIGIARENNERELKSNGADIVVKDLAEVDITRIDNWFKKGLKKDQWCLNYYDYSPKQERLREALCTVGNGYFGTRGAMEESRDDAIHYPGTYIAGLYNRLTSKVNNRSVSNEDLVNCPNWLPLQFRIGNDPWIEFDREEILDFHLQLDLKQGVLYRKIIIRDKKGRLTLVESSRLASMDDPHSAAQQYIIKPLNYAATLTVRAGIVFNVVNAGVERYKQLETQHLSLVSKGHDGNVIHVLTETKQSNIRIAEAAKITAFVQNEVINSTGFSIEDDNGIYLQVDSKLSEGQTFTIEKLVSIFSSRDKNGDDPLLKAKRLSSRLKSFDDIKQKSVKAREYLWQKTDIEIKGDRLAQKLLRLDIYHLLVTKSVHSSKTDWGIPARGLHGEAYRGHIFWDELFCLPFYCLYLPEAAKSTLLYRYHRLDKARAYAKENGYRGAMFPWQSGSDGREETQEYHLNPISGKWGRDNSRLQRHVSIAVAYNVWHYYRITLDQDFLVKYGAEMFLEIARFWASITEFNTQTGRYEINGVMGPDEFHEKYPDSDKAGLKNNSYTNIMVAWVFQKALEVLKLLPDNSRQGVAESIGLTEEEIAHWKNISKKLTIEISEDGIIEQFSGFFNLKELDWEKYHAEFDDIARMDRILKAHNDTPDRYKVIKQADVLMLFYLLSSDELKSIITDLGYSIGDQTLKQNFDYYFNRTSHGSTLSLIVHSALAYIVNYDKIGREMFQQSLVSDYCDIQGGTTGEGIHTGVMAGSVLHVIKIYAGIDFSKKQLQINPVLPRTWKKISFDLFFRKAWYNFDITSDRIKIIISKDDPGFEEIEVMGKKYSLQSKVPLEIWLT